ncbi:MAG: D-tyrosyl-tRNA(Tyr) deacylase [Nanoarchaeota archaeon]|nr:D-tyrosyl-tRNA(Tyr) deacylase [Nanoarchaeota archaeon]
MKAVIQRVNFAKVLVENQVVGEIKKGLLVFLAVSRDFNEEKMNWMINKILKLRVWSSKEKGFDLSVKDIENGEILIVSQFTLFGDCSKSNKPNFRNSMEFEKAEEIYNEFVNKLKEEGNGLKIETGRFGAKMDVKLENDGPVTIILEK